MSKLVLTNHETGHSQGCICDGCIKRAARILRNPELYLKPPPFDPGELLDFGKMPWPDEILAGKKKEGG